MRRRESVLAAVTVALIVLAAAYAAAAARDAALPTTSHATLVRSQPGVKEPAIGTAVRLDQVDEIAFATRRVGYALGGPFGSTYPLKTTNGGRSWFVDGPAFFLPVADGAAAVRDIAATGTWAYAYAGPSGGSSIATTSDAGRQWWRAWLGQGLAAVSQRGNDLWALAAGLTHSSSRDAVPPMLLYDSSDAGRTWTYRSTLSGVRGWWADLARPSATTAFALVQPFAGSTVLGGIVETTNGGATWTRRVDPCDRTLSKYSVNWTESLAASSDTSLWLFCGSQPATGSQIKLLERSYDAGRRWTVVASNATGRPAPPNIPYVGELPDTGTTGYLSVTSRSDAWLLLVGADVLWKTTDGGRTWVEGAPAKVERQFPQEFSFVGETMFVKTQNALWASSAAGWKRIAGSSKPY